MTNVDYDAKLDTLFEGWREPVVDPHFTQRVMANLPQQADEADFKTLSFPNLLGPGAIMGAAAAVLLLLVIGLAHTSRVAVESDLVELEGHSDDAMSELYRLIHMEALTGSDELAPEDADTALLLFATGG